VASDEEGLTLSPRKAMKYTVNDESRNLEQPRDASVLRINENRESDAKHEEEKNKASSGDENNDEIFGGVNETIMMTVE